MFANHSPNNIPNIRNSNSSNPIPMTRISPTGATPPNRPEDPID
jgi:hypothetical protein